MNERPGQCGAERTVIAMDLTERTLESHSIFEGKIVTLLVDQAELPDGKQASREVVLHPGGVAVLPLDGEGNVTLVQQYRYPFHQVILELPAGKLDAGEPHETAARRELSEETGLEAEELDRLQLRTQAMENLPERFYYFTWSSWNAEPAGLTRLLQ